jgi:predicted nuclease of predicted toxin-antitoxin system
VRFKVDENLPDEASELLRDAGHDSVTVRDEELSGADDRELAVVVQREKRALLSLDLDFSDIRAYPPQDYHGIIVIRAVPQDKLALLALVRHIIAALNTEPLQGKLWIVEADRIRVRDASS